MEESSSPSFLSPNSVLSSPELEISDNEMSTPKLQSYTSLKDLLSADTAAHSPPPSAVWNNELPIKNPLVKHAALAYLQPMLLPPPNLDSHGGFGCLRWLVALLFALTGGGIDRRW